MKTPFVKEVTKTFITEELHSALNLLGYIDIVFSSVTEELSDSEVEFIRKAGAPHYKDMTDEQIRAFEDGIDTEIAYQIWSSACLLDDVFNGRDYSADCIGYIEEYRAIIEILKVEITRKKFFSKKTVYNLPAILQNAIDALDYVLGVNNACELAESFKQNGVYEIFEKEIVDLQNRLSMHIK